MIVEVVTGADERPEARVVDIDDVSGVRLALGVVTDEEADQALKKAGLGRMKDAGTAVLDVATLRAAAEPRATAPDWHASWDAMIADVRAQGRLSEDGAVLSVHVESAAGT